MSALYRDDENDEEEESGEEGADEEDGNNDLEGLFAYFDELERRRGKLVEATYIVNKWALGGVIPMTHHGFNFRTSAGEYFSLDFSRKGIVWDTYGDEVPGLPDNTTLVQTYQIDVDPVVVRLYCEETKPFSWLRNDCDTWSQGLMHELGVGRPAEDRRRERQVCGLDEGVVVSSMRSFPSCGIMNAAEDTDMDNRCTATMPNQQKTAPGQQVQRHLLVHPGTQPIHVGPGYAVMGPVGPQQRPVAWYASPQAQTPQLSAQPSAAPATEKSSEHRKKRSGVCL